MAKKRIYKDFRGCYHQVTVSECKPRRKKANKQVIDYGCNENIMLEAASLTSKSISSILNEESKKLHQLIDEIKSSQEIYKINNSINDVLNNIIRLEDLIISKIKILSKETQN